MSSIQFNINNVIKQPKKIQTNIGGIIKTVKKIQTNIGGIIKTVYNAIELPNYNTSGLMMYLDGIINTLDGHSTTTNTWEDLSGNSNNMALTGVTWDDKSAIFAGSASHYGSNSSLDLTNPYTVEIVLGNKTNWINGVTIPFSNFNLSTSVSGDGIILRSTTAEVSFRVGTIKPISINKSALLETNVFTFQNNGTGTGYLYVNGNLVGSVTGVSTSSVTNNLTMGYSQAFYYAGSVKALRIYNRILTSTEINDNYLIDYQRFIATEVYPERILVSSGTQYINTGIIGKSTLKVEMKMNGITASNYTGVFGARDSCTSNRFGVFGNSSNQLRFDFGTQTGSFITSAIFVNTTPYILLKDGPNNYYNGSLVSTNTTASFTSSCNLTLFTHSTAGSPTYICAMKLYYCKIWDSGVLVRDYIPVQTGDICDGNTATANGLYDKVSKTYFYNVGTGTFSIE